MLGILSAGTMTMTMANEPGVEWGQGRFTPLFPQLVQVLTALYPPD